MGRRTLSSRSGLTEEDEGEDDALPMDSELPSAEQAEEIEATEKADASAPPSEGDEGDAGDEEE